MRLIKAFIINLGLLLAYIELESGSSFIWYIDEEREDIKNLFRNRYPK